MMASEGRERCKSGERKRLETPALDGRWCNGTTLIRVTVFRVCGYLMSEQAWPPTRPAHWSRKRPRRRNKASGAEECGEARPQ